MSEFHDSSATVGDLIALMDARYDPRTAESWDRVGLVCGDVAEPVRHVLFAVDPVAVVVDEAIATGADLIITHHPLFLSGVHAVATTDFKGRIVHRLIRAGIALFAAHTNADHASPGVSDAIASALGLIDVVPLEPLVGTGLDKYLVMTPSESAQGLVDALSAAGAGRIGNYDRAAFMSQGVGTFRPLDGANPTIGEVGLIEEVPETLIAMVAPRSRRAQVVAALRQAHPYEEPAFDVIELPGLPDARGIGRVGVLPEELSLSQFSELVAAALPATAQGVRVAGDPHRRIRRVALCGGSGDSLLGAATSSGADVYLTSDLRHHRASEHLESGGPALVDVAHWAAEWMWLPKAADLLVADALAAGHTVTAGVSTQVSDPWTAHLKGTFDEG